MKLFGLTTAWLSPSGEIVTDHDKFAPIGAWHEELAACIAGDLLNFKPSASSYSVTEKIRSMGGFAYVYEYLESLGWVRLCSWGGSTKVKWVVPDGLLQPQQRRVIKAWCRANNAKWEDVVDMCL